MSRSGIEKTLKRIKINDEGEYIEFSLDDEKFLGFFGDLVNWLDEQTGRGVELSKEKMRILDSECALDTQALADVLREEEEMSRQACRKIDAMFGAETCKKIFGDGTPRLYSVFDFIEQFSKLVERFANERNKKGRR